MTFLKRSFRFEPALSKIVGPLEVDSLMKNMHLRRVGSVLSEDQHVMSKIRETQEGFFFHGREKFDEWTERLTSYVAELGLEIHLMLRPFCTWDELVERYRLSEIRIRKWQKHVETGSAVLQCFTHNVCHKCGKFACILDDIHTRVCERCGFCRFEDWDLACFNCDENDICTKCLRKMSWFDDQMLCANRECTWYMLDDGQLTAKSIELFSGCRPRVRRANA
jgi:hypothetical protein